MEYEFSCQHLKICPPDKSFGEAWESLCDQLLRAEYGSHGVMRLQPPDRGIDILINSRNEAYQCKSSEQGSLGNIPPDHSCKSMETAVSCREVFQWSKYVFATNANYTGSGAEKIMKRAGELDIKMNDVAFLGPEHWNTLCVKHKSLISSRFNFRMVASNEQIEEAFRKARYFDEYVQGYMRSIKNDDFTLVISNNKNNLEVEIPFSPNLTIENYLDVSQQLLGISLEWQDNQDLKTSHAPALSVSVEGKAQSFKTKIKDLALLSGDKLEIWIRINLKDNFIDRNQDIGKAMEYKLKMMVIQLEDFSYGNARIPKTIERASRMLQDTIWRNSSQFKVKGL